MHKTIWKFPINLNSPKVRLPVEAEILCVQTQNGVPCLWAVVEPESIATEERLLGVYGTGHPIPDDPGRYIGTFQLSGGILVVHIFEKPNA